MRPIFATAQLWLIIIFTLSISHRGRFQEQRKWEITCYPSKPQIDIYETASIKFNITGPFNNVEYDLLVTSKDSNVLQAEKKIILNIDQNREFYSGNFNISGVFLGRTNVSLMVIERESNKTVFEDFLSVIVIRKKGAIDHIFLGSLIILLSLIFINFGCALNWDEIVLTLRKPFGPIIGFVGQFLFMPILSYVLAKLLFPNNPAMQLGMFFTGVSPGGGASNMWTVILGGNLDLSITMTTISTFASFVMIPLWTFTLGREIFKSGSIPIPYEKIATSAIGLILPLSIGFLMQKYMKNTAQFLARILKGLSLTLIIVIIIFAIFAKMYLFKLFSWKVLISGLFLPWLGYLLAWIISKLCRQSPKDCLTISIETGIQNTGIAIFLLNATLQQPEADITTVMPVAIATMTPIPLMTLYIYQKVSKRFCSNNKQETVTPLTNANGVHMRPMSYT